MVLTLKSKCYSLWCFWKSISLQKIADFAPFLPFLRGGTFWLRHDKNCHERENGKHVVAFNKQTKNNHNRHMFEQCHNGKSETTRRAKYLENYFGLATVVPCCCREEPALTPCFIIILLLINNTETPRKWHPACNCIAARTQGLNVPFNDWLLLVGWLLWLRCNPLSCPFSKAQSCKCVGELPCCITFDFNSGNQNLPGMMSGRALALNPKQTLSRENSKTVVRNREKSMLG